MGKHKVVGRGSSMTFRCPNWSLMTVSTSILSKSWNQMAIAQTHHDLLKSAYSFRTVGLSGC